MRVTYVKGKNADGTGGVRNRIDYSAVPAHCREGARAWVETGRESGDFLRAVLSDKLMEAFSRADFINLSAMPTWVGWLYNECPIRARGEHMASWAEIGGLFGHGFEVEKED